MQRLFILILIAAGCSRVPVKQELAMAIAQAASGGNGTVVDLGRLVEFAWDEVCVFGPFLRPVDVSKGLGFKWKGKMTGETGSLVFVDVKEPRSDSAATAHVPIRNNTVLIAASGCIPRSEARFVVQSSASSAPTLVPMTARREGERTLAPLFPTQ